MKEKTVLMKNGLYVSEEIANRLNPNRQSLKDEISRVSKPYDIQQWGKRHTPGKLKPKIVSKLAKVVNGKTDLDIITRDEYLSMQNKLEDIIKNWILT